MVDIKVGMYVRTKYGIICKILKLNEPFEDDGYLDHNDIGSSNIQEKDILKVSYNIIDLIEKGDYINNYKILDIVDVKDSNEKAITIFNHKGADIIYFYSNEDIKSVVTREQFENMKYEVE